MQLKYFTLTYNLDELKAQYRQLALKHHPDKNPDRIEEATIEMQNINAEMKYCYAISGMSTGKKQEATINDVINEVLKNEHLRPFMFAGLAAILLYGGFNFGKK